MRLRLRLPVTPRQAPTRLSAVATYKSDDHFTRDFESDEDELLLLLEEWCDLFDIELA